MYTRVERGCHTSRKDLFIIIRTNGLNSQNEMRLSERKNAASSPANISSHQPRLYGAVPRLGVLSLCLERPRFVMTSTAPDAPSPAAPRASTEAGRTPRASSGSSSWLYVRGVEVQTRVGGGNRGKKKEGGSHDRLIAMRAERLREASTMDPTDFESLYSWALVLQARRRALRVRSQTAGDRPRCAVSFETRDVSVSFVLRGRRRLCL